MTFLGKNRIDRSQPLELPPHAARRASVRVTWPSRGRSKLWACQHMVTVERRGDGHDRRCSGSHCSKFVRSRRVSPQLLEEVQKMILLFSSFFTLVFFFAKLRQCFRKFRYLFCWTKKNKQIMKTTQVIIIPAKTSYTKERIEWLLKRAVRHTNFNAVHFD